MNTLFSSDFWTAYALPSGVALSVFYLLYKGLVRNDNHLHIRRFVILGCLIFALTLPFLHFELPFNFGANRVETLYIETVPDDNLMMIIGAIHESPQQLHTPILLWYEIIGWTYLTVVLFLIGRGLVGILHLSAFSRKGKRLSAEMQLNIFNWSFTHLIIHP